MKTRNSTEAHHSRQHLNITRSTIASAVIAAFVMMGTVSARAQQAADNSAAAAPSEKAQTAKPAEHIEKAAKKAVHKKAKAKKKGKNLTQVTVPAVDVVAGTATTVVTETKPAVEVIPASGAPGASTSASDVKAAPTAQSTTASATPITDEITKRWSLTLANVFTAPNSQVTGVTKETNVDHLLTVVGGYKATQQLAYSLQMPFSYSAKPNSAYENGDAKVVATNIIKGVLPVDVFQIPIGVGFPTS